MKTMSLASSKEAFDKNRTIGLMQFLLPAADADNAFVLH